MRWRLTKRNPQSYALDASRGKLSLDFRTSEEVLLGDPIIISIHYIYSRYFANAS